MKKTPSEHINKFRLMYESGASCRTIARKFGVSYSCVNSNLVSLGVTMRTLTESRRTKTLNESAFEYWNQESKYWAGFLFADGSMRVGRGSDELVLSLSITDIDHVKKFAKFLGSGHKIGIIHRKEMRPGFEGSKSLARLSIRSNRICSALRSAGMKSHGASKPVKFLEESRDFWRGYVDGNGSIGMSSGKPRISAVGGIEIMESFKRFFLSSGAVKTASVNKHKSIFSISKERHQAESLIFHLYNGASCYLDRKYEKASQILNKAA